VRAGAVLLLLAAVASGDDTLAALRDLRARSSAARIEALRTLVSDQSPASARAIVAALDGAYARVSGLRNALFERQRAVDAAYAAYDAVWGEHSEKIDRSKRVGGGSKTGRDLNRELSDESRKRKARVAQLEEAYEPFLERFKVELEFTRRAEHALGKFRKWDAQEAIRRGTGTVIRSFTRRALVRVGASFDLASSHPFLLGMLEHEDPSVRRMALQVLPDAKDFLANLDDRVLKRVKTMREDANWPVRYAAWAWLARQDRIDHAAPTLVFARAEETGRGARVLDEHLNRLTGLAFTSAKDWSAWLKENGKKVHRRNWFFKERQPLPPRPYPGSRNIVFAVDFSEAAPTDEIRAAVERQLAALPDGSRFNIVTLSKKSERFSREQTERIDPKMRAKALRWLRARKPGGRGHLETLLSETLLDYQDDDRYFRLPDTIYLVAASGLMPRKDKEINVRRRKQRDARLFQLVEVWNRPVGVRFLTVGLGDWAPKAALKALAEATDGVFSETLSAP
jgi:hypothetical protein